MEHTHRIPTEARGKHYWTQILHAECGDCLTMVEYLLTGKGPINSHPYYAKTRKEIEDNLVDDLETRIDAYKRGEIFFHEIHDTETTIESCFVDADGRLWLCDEAGGQQGPRKLAG